MSNLAKDLSDKLRQRGWMMATAESCTGGMIASAITDLAGSSAIFDRGFVTYSNQAKIDLLGVSAKTLERFGAVSAETAKEMAEGAFDNANVNIAVSVTGIAGPDGGTDQKPVGLVYIGITTEDRTHTHKNLFAGSRNDIRQQTVEAALKLLLAELS
jgi:nicotinamide-nucleotide amidase